jgi:hypothetical protein
MHLTSQATVDLYHAAPTAPPGQRSQLLRAAYLFHLDLDESRRFAYTAPSNGPEHRQNLGFSLEIVKNRFK